MGFRSLRSGRDSYGIADIKQDQCLGPDDITYESTHWPTSQPCSRKMQLPPKRSSCWQLWKQRPLKPQMPQMRPMQLRRPRQPKQQPLLIGRTRRPWFDLQQLRMPTRSRKKVELSMDSPQRCFARGTPGAALTRDALAWADRHAAASSSSSSSSSLLLLLLWFPLLLLLSLSPSSLLLLPLLLLPPELEPPPPLELPPNHHVISNTPVPGE